MNPIIATQIATQRQRDLLASAEHARLVHRARSATRTAPARRTRPARRVRLRPAFAFHTWLTAGRL